MRSGRDAEGALQRGRVPAARVRAAASIGATVKWNWPGGYDLTVIAESALTLARHDRRAQAPDYFGVPEFEGALDIM